MGDCLANVVLLTFIGLFARIVNTQSAICDAQTFGKPQISDCTTLFTKFTEPQILQTRFFDEEQLRANPDDSWPGVDNPFVPPIVQLPKYYSMSVCPCRQASFASHIRANTSYFRRTDTCNFAIMPYVNPLTHSSNPLGISNWLSIKRNGSQLIADCLKQKSRSGGEIFVKDQVSMGPVLTIFMWAKGAAFEKKLNQYENEPRYSPQLSQELAGYVGTNKTVGKYLGNGTSDATKGNMSHLSLNMSDGLLSTSK